MALSAPPPNDRKRVKVYELKVNDWYDRGTGFCSGALVNVSGAVFVLLPVSGCGSPADDALPCRTRRESSCSRKTSPVGRFSRRGYQRTMDIRSSRVRISRFAGWRMLRMFSLTMGTDTLIVWTEPNGTDMALSFQEAEGCGAIWCDAIALSSCARLIRGRDFVNEVQQRLMVVAGPGTHPHS